MLTQFSREGPTLTRSQLAAVLAEFFREQVRAAAGCTGRKAVKREMRVIGLYLARYAPRLLHLSGESKKCTNPAPEEALTRPLEQTLPIQSQRFLELAP